MVALTLASVLLPAQVMSQQNSRYSALLDLRSRVAPEQVADSYVDEFMVRSTGRDTQAIWELVRGKGLSIEEATESHFARVRELEADIYNEALQERLEETREEIERLAIVHDLVLAYEQTSIDADLVVEAMREGWSDKRWDAPRPMSAYLDEISARAERYRHQDGLTPADAAIRAGVDTRSQRDRERGVSASAITTPESPHYDYDLGQYEHWLRTYALIKARGRLTEAEATNVPERLKGMSRLSYYTRYLGGSDYYFDRLATWQIAAGDRPGHAFH